MFDKRRLRHDFSNAAAEYETHAKLQQTVMQHLLEHAKSLLPANGKILDAGSGTGKLAPLVPQLSVTQIDGAFAMSMESAKRAPAINGDIEALPFADNTFDVVFSSLVLQWVHDWKHAIAEMKRVLKPGGVLAMSTFGDGTLYELKESFTAGDRYPHVSEFTPDKEFAQSETIVEYYPNLSSLMQHLKNIGARNKLAQRSKSLMTARQLQAVESYYRKHFGAEQGLPATWKVLYSVTRKP